MICCVVIFPMPRDHRVSGALLALADLLTSEAGAGCGEVAILSLEDPQVLLIALSITGNCTGRD